jgi:fumarate hydratase subunit alpha
LTDADCLELTCSPKGAGCEFWSALKMFGPVDPIATMKKFVIDRLVEASGRPCPPVVLGVGWGGTFSEAALLAKKAAIRSLKLRHHEMEIAKIETELLNAANSTNIGPMGLGGDTTVLAVNIETAFTHRPWNPVAVNVQDWICRRATARMYDNGEFQYIQET